MESSLQGVDISKEKWEQAKSETKEQVTNEVKTENPSSFKTETLDELDNEQRPADSFPYDEEDRNI